MLHNAYTNNIDYMYRSAFHVGRLLRRGFKMGQRVK